MKFKIINYKQKGAHSEQMHGNFYDAFPIVSSGDDRIFIEVNG
ncbi:MAG TPA: hypothetical protein VF648_16845 [Pyrinomonadaceae bacterium]